MKLNNKKAIAVAIALVGVCAAYWTLGHRNLSSPGPVAAVASSGLTRVEVIHPVRAQMDQFYSATGQVFAQTEASVELQVSGLPVKNIFVKAGDTVHAGQVLAQLDPTSVVLEKNQVKASLEEAQANLEQAQLNLQRSRSIADSGAVSGLELTQYETQFKLTSARVKSLSAQLDLLENKLDKARVVSPLSGYVAARTLSLGVSSLAGQKAFRIFSPETEVRLEMPGSLIGKVNKGTSVQLWSSNTPTRVNAKVSRVAKSLDDAKNAIAFVELSAKEPFSVGQFVFAPISLGQHEVLTLPSSALIAKNGFTYVAQVVEGRVQFKKVEIGQVQDERAEVVSGLSEKDSVVLKGAAFLSEQEKVEIVPSEQKVSQ